jgi:probable rRNA maturation factor
MIVLIKNKQRTHPVKAVRGTIESAIRTAMRHEPFFERLEEQGITPVFSVLLTDDAGIRRLNARFRGIDRETDVLSFPAMEAGGRVMDQVPPDGMGYSPDDLRELMVGDMAVSLPRVLAQAELLGHSFERELSFLIVHSLLHLIGYDHEKATDETRMIQAQQRIMNDINHPSTIEGE